MYFKYYTRNYKNPQANVYNYTGLTAVTPNGWSMVIAYSNWISMKPTGLYISNSTSSNSSIGRVEQGAEYTLLGLTVIFLSTKSEQIYVFDRRESIPSIENSFFLFIYPLKYKQV